MSRLIQVEEQVAWDRFIQADPWNAFPQAWAWGEFQQTRGRTVVRFALVDERGHWLAAGQGIWYPKRYGTGYWLFPRGPVFASHITEPREVFCTFLEALVQTRLPHKGLFFRVEPPLTLEASPRRLRKSAKPKDFILFLQVSKRLILTRMPWL